MKTLPVGELKANFSEVLDRVKRGEKIAVSFGRRKKKVAVMIPYSDYEPSESGDSGVMEQSVSYGADDDSGITMKEFLGAELFLALHRRATLDNRSVKQEVVTIIKQFLSKPSVSTTVDEAALSLAGSWSDDRSADEIAESIRSARNTKRFKEGL